MRTLQQLGIASLFEITEGQQMKKSAQTISKRLALLAAGGALIKNTAQLVRIEEPTRGEVDMKPKAAENFFKDMFLGKRASLPSPPPH